MVLGFRNSFSPKEKIMSNSKDLKITLCPLCDSKEYNILKSLKIPSFDKSLLYQSIELVSCNECGHIYNMLTKTEFDNILKFYKTEHDELDSGSTQNNVIRKRNNDCFEVLSRHCNHLSNILDLGCGEGHFLEYLYEKEYKKLSGFDLADSFKDKSGKRYMINLGDAENLPYENNSFDILVLDQFLEHVISPKKILKEAFRVTKIDGKVLVGVPNASNYNKYQMFPLFMIILREHIQHFDISHMNLLAHDIGFDVEEVNETVFPMQAMNMPMSNLYIVLKKTKEPKNKPVKINKFKLKKNMIEYLNTNNEKLKFMKDQILKYIKMGKTIFFWGIGREFFLVYSMLSSQKKKYCKFIDANKRKQKSQKIDGKEIIDGSELKKLKQDNIAVVITAVYHVPAIEMYLNDINFKGDVVKIFEFNK